VEKGGVFPPYVTRLTSDSLDDIVFSITFDPLPVQDTDSCYLALFRGGQHLYDQGKDAMWDDTAFYANISFAPLDSVHRSPVQGDWRGAGHDDLIAYDYLGNFFYYKNDTPFDLHNLVRALKQDTILKSTDWSHYATDFSKSAGAYMICESMQAFPRSPGDRSQDLLISLPVRSGTGHDPFNRNGICIYHGGPSFGTKRLYFDSADYFLHCPGYYSGLFAGTLWGGPFNVGDLTGTGNNVLLTSGGAGIGNGFVAFYVLGKAMDDKIDAFKSFQDGNGNVDTIIATDKGIPTFISGAPYYNSPDDQNNGFFEKGSVWALYGTENIPVHLNPKYSVKQHQSLDTSRYHLYAYPNPCDEKTVLVFDNCTGGKMLLDVMNSAGQFVDHEETPGGYGVQEYAVFLNTLPAGAYFLRLSCPADGWSATTSVIKTGAAEAPWKLDLHSLVK
jgi:hypothetical protein